MKQNLNKSKEFNVRVESACDFRVVGREEAIQEAHRQVQAMVDKGYKKECVYVNFYHEDTKEHLGIMTLCGDGLVSCEYVVPL